MMHDVAIDIPILENHAVLATTTINLQSYLEMLTWNGGEKITVVAVEGSFIGLQEELQAVVDTYQRKGFISPTPASMVVLQEAIGRL